MKPLPITKEEAEEAREMFAANRPISDIAEYIGCEPDQVKAVVLSVTARPRTSGGLRDLLFDEIASLQRGDTEPQRAAAVANLAKQIINVAKAEIEFGRTTADQKGAPALGSLRLGSEPETPSTESGAG